MENTTPTSRPVAQLVEHTPDGWTIEILENNQGWHFISPSNYVFGFENIDDALDMVVDILSEQTTSRTMYCDRFYAVDGVLSVHEADSWLNPNFNYDDYICHSYEFAKTVLNAEKKWKRN